MSEPLKAGRELDQLVSDAIFGSWDESLCRVCGWKIVPDGEQGCWRDNCSLRPPPTRRADEPQPYTTDIAAAWKIVEKCHLSVLQMEEGDWHVYGPTDRTATEATAPLAICIAALRAVRARPTEQETPQ